MSVETNDPVTILGRLAELDPGERRALLVETDRPDERLLALADAAERMVIDDLDRALAMSAMLVEIGDEVGCAETRARVRRAFGQALAYASRFGDSLDVLDAALRLATDAGCDVEAARVRSARLHALAKQGRYEAAIEEGEAARRAFIKAGHEPLAARVDINLGVTHRMRDDPRMALTCFDRARPRLDGEPHILAQLDSNRAEALLDLGRFGDAEVAFQLARQAFDDLGMGRASAIVDGNLGDLMSRQGRLQGALDHFERARRRLADDGASGEIPRIEAEQAEAFAAAGQLEEAVTCYRHAVPALDACGLAWDGARARTGLGRALVELGRLDAAAASLAEAATAFQTLKHASGQARVETLEGYLCWRRGDAAGARVKLTAALTRLADDPPGNAAVRMSLAVIELDAGRLDRAETLLADAFEVVETLQLVPRLVDALQVRSRLHAAQGSHHEAVADLREAARHIERLRGSLRGDRSRMAFFGNRMNVYETLVAALLASGAPADEAEAFDVVEQAKSRSLLDLMNGAAALLDTDRGGRVGTSEVDLLRDVTRLQGELTALYGQFDELRRTDRVHDATVHWREAVAAVEDRLRLHESRLAATDGLRHLAASPAGLGAIAAILPARTAIVEYYRAGERWLVFVVGPAGLMEVATLGDAPALEDALDRVHFQIARAIGRVAQGGEVDEDLVDDARHELSRLHDLILGPIRHRLDGLDRLYVVPHGPLHLVPFGALHDGERHLIERMEIVTAPSASLLGRLRAPAPTGRAHAPGRAVVAGVWDEGTPEIANEITTVAAALGGADVIRGEDATIDRVLHDAGGARVVHLACHGRFSTLHPRATGLRLADGWLTAADICAAQLAGATVVLSGCDTGGAAIESGDELIGLVRAFLAAGARGLVTSLWSVSDQSTAVLMESFYRAWQNGHETREACPATALREAQRMLMRSRPHPVFWSPFIVIGGAA